MYRKSNVNKSPIVYFVYFCNRNTEVSSYPLDKSMGTYNIILNDELVEKARPAFPDENALQCWLQEQVVDALERLVKKNSEANQCAMVKESMTRAFEELHSGRVKKNARELF